mgnify:CR=1 FL=1
MVKQNKNMKTETKIEYRKNGQIKHKCDYVNGKKHGEYIDYYRDGSIETKCSYVNGEKHGEYIVYFDDGDIDTKCNYVNGQRHGEYIEYHTNGNLLEKTDYVNGQVHGKNTTYYTNGQIMGETEYVNGNKCGKRACYDEFGFCEFRCEIDANGNYNVSEKWKRIYETNGHFTYQEREYDNRFGQLKEGEIFYCEGRYYEITRGSLTHDHWSIKKSTNLQIRHLEWQLDSAYIEIIDDAKKEIIDCSVYKLKPYGNKFTKFLTAKKNFVITSMNNAELVVKHKKVKQREKYLEEIIKGINKKFYPEIVD